MGNKKGFTLTEILATLAILAIIIAIAVPSLNALIKSFEKKYYESLESTVLSSAKNYYKDHPEERPTGILYSSAITINGLIKNKYIDSAKVYKKNDNCKGYVLVVNEGEGKYNYKTCMVCNNSLTVKNKDDKKYCAYDDNGEINENSEDATVKLITDNDGNTLEKDEKETIVNSSKAINTKAVNDIAGEIYLPYAEDFVMNNHWKKYIDYHLNQKIELTINNKDEKLFSTSLPDYKPVNISNIVLNPTLDGEDKDKTYKVTYKSNKSSGSSDTESAPVDVDVNVNVIIKKIGNATITNSKLGNPITKDDALSRLSYDSNGDDTSSVEEYDEKSKSWKEQSGEISENKQYRFKYTEKINNEDYIFYSGPTKVALIPIKRPDKTLCIENLVYNGAEQEIATAQADAGYTLSNNTATNAGEYTITATLDDGYEWDDNTKDEKTFKCSISKATPIIKLSSKSGSILNGKSGTFTATVKSGIATTVSGNLDVTSTVPQAAKATIKNSKITDADNETGKTIEITISGVTIGDSEIKIDFKPSDTTNFNEANETYKVNIVGSATPPTSNLCKTGLVYNGSSQTIAEAGIGYSLTGNKETNAGTYTVTATLQSGYIWTDGTNGAVTFECEISKRSITVTANSKSKEYDGNSLTDKNAEITKGSLVTGHKIDITVNGEQTEPGSSENTITNVVIKNQANEDVSENYKITTVPGKLTVSKKRISKPLCKNPVYSGTEQEIATAQAGYTLSNNTATNAGTYTVTATLQSGYIWTDGTNGAVTFNCNIEKKKLGIEYYAITKLYDGNIINIKCKYSDSNRPVNGEECYCNDKAYKEVGEYKDVVKPYVENKSTKERTTNNYDITIERADISIGELKLDVKITNSFGNTYTEGNWTNKNLTISATISATNNVAFEIKSVLFDGAYSDSYDGNTYIKTYTQSINKEILIKATTESGVSVEKKVVLKIDKEAPDVPTIKYYKSSDYTSNELNLDTYSYIGEISDERIIWSNSEALYRTISTTEKGGSGVEKFQWSNDVSVCGTSNESTDSGREYVSNTKINNNLVTANIDFKLTSENKACFRAVDKAGNVSAWSQQHDVKFDREAPYVAFVREENDYNRFCGSGITYCSTNWITSTGYADGRLSNNTKTAFIQQNFKIIGKCSSCTAFSVVDPVYSGITYFRIKACKATTECKWGEIIKLTKKDDMETVINQMPIGDYCDDGSGCKGIDTYFWIKFGDFAGNWSDSALGYKRSWS